jgi:hypothetical protein
VLSTAALGAGLLALLGAPVRLPAMNLGAALVGALLIPLLAPGGREALRHPMVALVAVATAIWITALGGADLDGVRRWAAAGPLLFHVGFLVLPVALAVLPRAPWPVGILGAGMIAAALVAQPDSGSALALAAGAAVLALRQRSASSVAGLAIAVAATVAAFLRPDPLPAVRFVERVVPLAFDGSPALGALALAALFLPSAALAFVAWRHPALTVAGPAAGFWLGAALASLVGNYPTPIAGSGVTPVLAYALTWALIVAERDAAERTRTSPPGSPASGASIL